MKTTLEIPDDLFREAKARAALEGRKLKDLVAEALRQAVQQPVGTGRLRTVQFPILRSRRPGVLTAEAVSKAEASLEQELAAGHAKLVRR